MVPKRQALWRPHGHGANQTIECRVYTHLTATDSQVEVGPRSCSTCHGPRFRSLSLRPQASLCAVQSALDYIRTTCLQSSSLSEVWIRISLKLETRYRRSPLRSMQERFTDPTCQTGYHVCGVQYSSCHTNITVIFLLGTIMSQVIDILVSSRSPFNIKLMIRQVWGASCYPSAYQAR